MIAFRLEQWRAWAPGLSSQQDWHDWAQAPTVVAETAQQPECLSLPPMQRRRLSRLARMTMEVASPLCGDDEQLPFVFGSRHGETSRTLNLLQDVAAEQPLSPTHFGLSVHNAIAGQWSLLRGQRGESVAIAGEADTFEHTMLEAAAMLADGAPTVLAVIAEEVPPAVYDGWVDDVPFSYAVALRLGRVDAIDAAPSDSCWTLELGRHQGETAGCAWPHALDFLRALQTAETSLAHPWKTRQWQWQRTR
ncbi:MAG: beta-ketoacyl synthase chain length factor [Pseudomonadota bacterium]|nr:beta-ketoacyl synthase chain length factor [Pseudomonadota bacterium]